MRVAAGQGFCEQDADPFEAITRGEAAFILHMMLTRFGMKVPQELKVLPIRNEAGADMSVFMAEPQCVPVNILRRFQDKAWFYSVDFGYLDDLSDRYGMTCVGATNYRTKHIYVSKAYATLHEFGHFLHGELKDPGSVSNGICRYGLVSSGLRKERLLRIFCGILCVLA